MKLHPLGNRVLIKKLERAEKTPGGLYIPRTAQDERAAAQGTIIEVGPAITELKAGDVVFFQRYAGQEVNIDDVAHTLVTEDEVFGVINDA